MSAFDIVLVVYGAILALAALAVVFRMIVGPTILDRAISSESLVTLVVMGMAIYTAHAQAAWAGPAMLSLTGLAFVGSVTFARFVAREDPMQGRRPHPEEPSTDTGPHEAIHAEPGEQTADGLPAPHPSAPEAAPLSADDPEEDSEHPGEPLPPAGGDGAADGADDGSEVGFGAESGSSRGFEDDWTEERR
ncbi:monovalent cation/H+ antiporter complex subunit F [Brachybacterium aquaticum]|uniref:Multicomponent Na+:H+ antiporter subunit F n=1 Tax=Brachybacterium aquaticum TaxID=1432564 RepID=A0A841ABB3_9MICO|nr:monovalent cation/H+ antiporter complex subunit F [Brachybacterium aquaticum]MBB5830484.1 multicomponent Na+:H+ antiporter subunit F [Brachybacterium aquaticum]